VVRIDDVVADLVGALGSLDLEVDGRSLFNYLLC